MLKHRAPQRKGPSLPQRPASRSEPVPLLGRVNRIQVDRKSRRVEKLLDPQHLGAQRIRDGEPHEFSIASDAHALWKVFNAPKFLVHSP